MIDNSGSSRIARLYNHDGYRRLEPENPKKTNYLKLFSLVLLFATIASWLVYAILSDLQGGKSGEVAMLIEAPANIAPGGEVLYKIVIDNGTTDQVSDIDLRLNYPEGFSFESANFEAVSSTNNTFQFATLDTGEKIELNIKGNLLGEAGSYRTLFAVATYNLPNFSSSLEISESASTVLGEPVVKLNLIGETQLLPHTEYNYEFKYENISDKDLGDLQLALSVPNGAVVVDWRFDEQHQRWLKSLPLLESASEATELVVIRFGDTVGHQKLTVEVQGDSNAQKFNLAEAELDVIIGSGDYVATITVNGTDQPQAVSAGDSLDYRLKLENISNSDLQDWEITLIAESTNINTAGIQTSDGQKNANRVVWSGKNNSTLNKFAPKETIDLKVTLPILTDGINNEPIVLKTVASYVKDDQQFSDVTLSEIIIPMGGQVELSTKANYRAAKGPVPPQAGAETTVDAEIVVSENLNGLKNASVIIALGENVSFVSANSLLNDVVKISDQQYRWYIGDANAKSMPAVSVRVKLLPQQRGAMQVLRASLSGNSQFNNDSVQVESELVVDVGGES